MLGRDSYSGLSIALHWFTAIMVVALFLTHEGERGSLERTFHISVGAIAGIFILWRVFRRLRKGLAAEPDQHALLNLASRLVLYGFLVCLVVVILTGYFLPWTRGAPLDVFGLAIPSPMPGVGWAHELAEEMHDISGHLFIPLLALHVAGVVKHALFDKDRRKILARMSRPDPKGL